MQAAGQPHIQYQWLAIVILAVASLTCMDGCDVSDASANTKSPVAAAVDAPGTILVDSQHAMVDLTSASKPYLAEGGAQIIVKSKDFAFRDPKHLARTPNVLRVLHNKSEYAVDWTDQAVPCALNTRTLRLVKGIPFDGFKPGDRAIIGVGFESGGSDSQRRNFQEFWVASILFH